MRKGNPIHLLSIFGILLAVCEPHHGEPPSVHLAGSIGPKTEHFSTLRLRRRRGDVDVAVPCEDIVGTAC